MQTQYKKVWEDLFENLSKTVLVILSITLGVFGLGVILNTYSITDREMNASYLATNPASFIISVDKADEQLLKLIGEHENVEQLQQRKTIVARVGNKEDEWYQTTLTVIEGQKIPEMNTFYSRNGKEFPQRGEILLENTSLSVVNRNIAETLRVKLPKSKVKELTIAGSVQADGTNPAWMHEEVIGYISEETWKDFESPEKSTEILVASKEGMDKNNLLLLSEKVRYEAEALGYHVNYVQVPEQGVHPNALQMNAILMLFRIFGALALILSAILVYSIVSSVLQGQIKQIAIMKSMGASAGQIRTMYYLYVILMGAAASILAIPTAKFISASLCDFTAAILVFTVRDNSVPVRIYLLQAVVAILVPVFAATVPIQRGCRMSIVDGLYDSVKEKNRHSRISIRNTAISMGIRNTFRKPSRLLFAVLTLALGGAIFMASMNVRVSLEQSFSNMLAEYPMDAQFVLSDNYSEQEIREVLSKVDGIQEISSTVVSYGSIIEKSEGDAKNRTYDNSKPLRQVLVVHKEKTDCESVFHQTEEAFRNGGIDVLSGMTTVRAEIIYQKHLYTVASFLIGASVLVILVGIISLISISEMNVTDRRKELGIMRSFGTNAHTVFGVVYVENLLSGWLGFLLSLLLAIPLSVGIGNRFGEIFLGKSLPHAFSFSGVLLWFILSTLLGTIVSIVSVRKIVKQQVNIILSYE